MDSYPSDERTVADLVAQTATSDRDDAERAIEIAQELLTRSRELQTPQERRQQAELDRMIGHAEDKATLIEMTDQAFRTLTPSRVADQLTHILDLQGVPRFFSPLDRTMLRGFQSFGEYLPGVAVPLVKDKMRRETANVILPAETELLSEHLRRRQQEGVRMNVNFLGEALLGEAAAARRLKRYVEALRTPDVECISVKITTIFSQVSPLAREHTVQVVADRLERLYRAAARESFQPPAAPAISKFVYLDMEEYRDLHLTVESMKRALDRCGMEEVRAGIALQAYLPDSYPVLKELLLWAQRRVERGGQPLTIRLVKGANMEMERIEASHGNWPLAPFGSKLETDANYKRMLRTMLDPAYRNCLRIGVASHNLFDIALAMLWAERFNLQDGVQYEMLEGMANHQRRALFETTRSVLLYAPACRQSEFIHAIAYLVRRLDENTGARNFLRHTFRLQTDSDAWNLLAEDFSDSLRQMETVGQQPHRQQNRFQSQPQPVAAAHWSQYRGEPDTDWSLPIHAQWAETIVARWRAKSEEDAETLPLVIAGHPEFTASGRPRESFDPSRPGVVACRFYEAAEEAIKRAVACADEDPTGWRMTSIEQRHGLLRAAAQLLRERRGDLIGAAMLDGAKTIPEADAEVSEAIDFTELYPLTVAAHLRRQRIECRARGTTLVVSPWNFPLAIPCGGVAASLATGNTVLLKPASDTVLPAYKIAECFWDAGVPREVLQFVPCSGGKGGRQLVNDLRVQTVILTGGTATAKQMLTDRPNLHLIAETGGKNATIVTALSDRDLAIKHLLHSAFSHSGQKCSATSLLLLEDEVFEDAEFQGTLADAVQSLPVGPVWETHNRMGPLIRPPSGDLARGLKELEPGESWLVFPEPIPGNPQLYRPGVKWNVQPGSFTHSTELFGPVLGVMRYRRLDDAIGIVNATGYGLTSGLESLDDREQELWQQKIRAGNLYVNRSTTGAIVLRQPFGGVGESAFGPGIKAGGPNYVLPLMRIENRAGQLARKQHASTGAGDPNHSRPNSALVTEERAAEDDLERLRRLLEERPTSHFLTPAESQLIEEAMEDLRATAESEFLREHDSVGLLGQDNFRRYRPIPHMRLRLHASDVASDLIIAVAAAVAVRASLVVSYPPDVEQQKSELIEWLEHVADQLSRRVEVLEETDAELAAAIEAGAVDRLRTLQTLPPQHPLHLACREAFVSNIDQPVVYEGYVEALRYVSEQSLSVDYHRYGNLGRRHE